MGRLTHGMMFYETEILTFSEWIRGMPIGDTFAYEYDKSTDILTVLAPGGVRETFRLKNHPEGGGIWKLYWKYMSRIQSLDRQRKKYFRNREKEQKNKHESD